MVWNYRATEKKIYMIFEFEMIVRSIDLKHFGMRKGDEIMGLSQAETDSVGANGLATIGFWSSCGHGIQLKHAMNSLILSESMFQTARDRI